ncbi:Serine carboxypeptidase II-2 [Asimina triloba]
MMKIAKQCSGSCAIPAPDTLPNMEEKKKQQFICAASSVRHPLLLLLIVIIALRGTPGRVICANVNDEAEKDRVSELPGANSLNVTFAHYSGYIAVNEEPARNLFYWFFEAVEDPSSKPLVLWLNGGSIRFWEASFSASGQISIQKYLNCYCASKKERAVFLDISLRTIEYAVSRIINEVANILFIDSPVGVGYSYSDNPEDLLSNGDARTAQDSLTFLKKWFKRFPQYEGREFYLTGESYAGHYVPQLAQAIVRSMKLTGESSINLKGYMVGNALTDDFHDHLGVFQFMWSTGLISDDTYKLLNVFCDFQSFVHTSAKCEKILDIASNELGNIDPYSIFTPSCTGNITSSNRLLKRLHSVGRVGGSYDPCTEEHSTIYFNLPEVQKALHVDPAVAPFKWSTCRSRSAKFKILRICQSFLVLVIGALFQRLNNKV